MDVDHFRQFAASNRWANRRQGHSTGQIPSGAFNKAIFPESDRHRGSSEPETDQRLPSPDGCALASCIRR